MSHHNEYDEHTAFRDRQTAQDVRFLMQGLQQLAPDPHAEVPPHFHATVMARAQALPLPRKSWWTQLRARLTVWVPVFAVGLMLSLSVHVWQGIRALRLSQPGTTQSTAGSPMPIYQFQAQWAHGTALQSLVAIRPVPEMPRTTIGFTVHATRSTFVRMGILYADVLAAIQSGAKEVAADRLRLLLQAVSNLQAPPVLAQYLRDMQAVLQRQAPDNTTAQLMALFEPLYAQVYATDPHAAPRVLFQTGAWLENLALAAALGDQGVVQQAQVVQDLRDALRPLSVPNTVLDGLEQLHLLLAHQPATTTDLHAIQTLADTIKQHLMP